MRPGETGAQGNRDPKGLQDSVSKPGHDAGRKTHDFDLNRLFCEFLAFERSYLPKSIIVAAESLFTEKTTSGVLEDEPRKVTVGG